MKRELRELIVCCTDAYKLFHRQMYPKNTVTVYSNGTPRSSKHYKGNNKDEVIVFGTQRLVRLMNDKFNEFFAMSEDEVIAFCKEQLSSFTGTDYDTSHILYLHRLQKLPLVVKSLPEGSKCPIKVPYMTFYNTDPKCFWLTNYLETFISCETWSSITNATIANEYREIFEKWSMETVGNIDFVPFQGHDFSMRGMMSTEAARTSGLAHLTSFCGSDTIPSYLDAQYYYDSGQNDFEKGHIVATSVPATEHSVQCAYFNPEDGNELAYLDAILDEFPTGIVSIVCDGYDFWKFITEIVPMRKDRIMNRGSYESTIDNETFTHCVNEKGEFLYYRGVNTTLDAKQMRLALQEGTIIYTPGKVVFRPDSGNPADIICGMTIMAMDELETFIYSDDYAYKVDHIVIKHTDGKYYPAFTESYPDGCVADFGIDLDEKPLNSSVTKGAIECLWDIFGDTESSEGYKLLDEHVGLIYGDSISLQLAEDVCSRLADKGFASINWVAGIGSYTYQFNTRDSHGQAIKATYTEVTYNKPKFKGDINMVIDGKNIFKDPATGDGLKKSAKGLLMVQKSESGDSLELVDEVDWTTEAKGELRIIFKDSELFNQETLMQIRDRIKS